MTGTKITRMLSLFFVLVTWNNIVLGQSTQPNVQIVEENGMRYQVTRSRVSQPVRDYRFVDVPQYTYQRQLVSETRPVSQTRFVPQTTYDCVPRLYDWWRVMGVFGQPYVAYGMEPNTRWVRQTQSLNVPVVRQTTVPYRRTVRMAVPYLRFEEREQVSKIALGPATSSGQIAATPQVATPRPPVAARPSPPIAPPRYIPAPATVASPVDPYVRRGLAGWQPSFGRSSGSLTRNHEIGDNNFQTQSWYHAGAPGVGSGYVPPPSAETGGVYRTNGYGRYGGVAQMDDDPPRYGTSLR